MTLLVMHECCTRERSVEESDHSAASTGMRVVAYLLAAKVPVRLWLCS
jgi:hypothetical protein